MSNNIPTNKALYARVKAEAKKKFDRWPSAYGSAWLVKEYKRRGGTYRKAQLGTELQGPPEMNIGPVRTYPGDLIQGPEQLVPKQIPFDAAPPYTGMGREEFLQRQAYQESRFKPRAESPKGYKGATQIGEDIMSDYEKATGDTRHDPFNPAYAVDVQRWAMGKYMDNTDWIKGSPRVKQAKALAAYNWGPGNTLDFLNDAKASGVDIYSNDLEWMKGMPGETRKYINHIMDLDYSDEPNWERSYKEAKDTSEVAKLYDFAMGGMMYSDTDLPSYKSGGIPTRYRNMGFTKVGVKKKSTRPGKKWMVLAKKGDKYKVVHGGDSNMQDFTQHRSKDRQKKFWDRMGGRNSAKAKDPFSPLYWHKRFGTWQEGGELNDPSMDRTITSARKQEMDQIAANDFAASTSGYRTISPERQFLNDYVSYTDSIGFPISEEEYSKRTGITPDMYRTITPERQAEDFRNYQKGGINNPGFRALPPEVQDKIKANMQMGGTKPCYKCGGLTKYQFAGTNMPNPFSQEEQQFMQDAYGTPADQTASMEWPTLDTSPLENMVYEEEPQAEDNFEFIPGRSDNMRTTKNWMMQTEAGKLPIFTHKSGKKFNLDKAWQTVDAVSGLAGMMGRNAKQSRQLQQNKQRQFTDNLYDPIKAGEIGSRGDYNISGQFRPDRVANWNPYMAESFNTTPFYQEGGVTEMTDAEIERLRAMGADIEILD